MTVVINKQSCPHCGQSMNIREIGLFSGMVESLMRVFQWCEETGKWTGIRRSELEHCMRGTSQTMRFHDWKIFAPTMVGGEKKGHYDFNRYNILLFLTGKTMVPTKILRNPLTKEDLFADFLPVHQIPHLDTFMTDNHEFIVKYRDTLL